MKKILISAATAFTFGLTAFLIIPKESSAQVFCACFNPGTYKVLKIKKNIATNTIISTTNLGCLNEAQIGALPPIPITDPIIREYYDVGC